MDEIAKDAPTKANVLELQDNTCANCGLDFSEEEPPRFRYLLPPSGGGENIEDNVEAVCKRCFSESGSESAD